MGNVRKRQRSTTSFLWTKFRFRWKGLIIVHEHSRFNFLKMAFPFHSPRCTLNNLLIHSFTNVSRPYIQLCFAYQWISLFNNLSLFNDQSVNSWFIDQSSVQSITQLINQSINLLLIKQCSTNHLIYQSIIQ